MEQLANLLEAILDQISDNKITITVERERNYYKINVKDILSDVDDAFGISMEKAVNEMVKKMQSFVDEKVS